MRDWERSYQPGQRGKRKKERKKSGRGWAVVRLEKRESTREREREKRVRERDREWERETEGESKREREIDRERERERKREKRVRERDRESESDTERERERERLIEREWQRESEREKEREETGEGLMDKFVSVSMECNFRFYQTFLLNSWYRVAYHDGGPSVFHLLASNKTFRGLRRRRVGVRKEKWGRGRGRVRDDV